VHLYIIICVIISIFGTSESSRSSRSSKWESTNEIDHFMIEKVCCLNHLKEKYLGQIQGKHNILKFLEIFCVRNGNSLKRFAYFSSFQSSLCRINNIILRNVVTKELPRGKKLVSGILGESECSNKTKRLESSTLGKRYNKFAKLKLIMGGIHPNPGPGANRTNLSFTTFNCRGLKEIGKFRRLMSKINLLLEQNRIVALQETHRVEDRLLEIYCKHNYVKNCVLENKAGVILFFNNSYEVKKQILDKESRYIIVAIESPLIKLVVGNVYFPNDHKEAKTFGENYYRQIRECQSEYPENYIVTMGDYNTCFGQGDSINRTSNKTELELVKRLTSENEECEIGDVYRYIHKEGGFTWSRGSCFSRLDYIFVSDYLMGKIQKVDTNWSFEKSDHAAITCLLRVEEKVERGPGIARVNCKLLDNDKTKAEIRKEIEELAGQVIPTWNPHTKLEFIKMAIRTAFTNVATISNKTKKDELEELEVQINRLKTLREECAREGRDDDERSNKIDESLNEINNMIEEVRNRHSEDIAFKAGAKWYEEGEKSSKYFLGLLKKRTSQKLISNLVDEGEELSTKESIMECIRKFYTKLYDRKEVSGSETDEGFFENCPKLNSINKTNVERDITLDELKETLKGCKESSPGPDGITYRIYKEFWDIIGIYIVDSWNHSVKTGILPPSNKESALTLLPKNGKDLREIKNWRPITLTNCDAKIITKALAVRMSKVLESIIDPSQTAYIPGRSVMDNLRSNLFTKNHCNNKKIDALLVSLDAKKAFDSVDHDYIRKVLKVYGFGDKFIGYFNTLYKDIQVRILVNGFFSEKIDIKRGVKQGDALSCSLFILCVDPLIRNLNNNSEIEGVVIKNKKTKETVVVKASGYADDIAVFCQNNRKSLEYIFKEYERLTKLSGLELNADKTEILQLGQENDRVEAYEFSYMNTHFSLKAVEKIKICGLVFCNDYNLEYEENIMEKIDKLESQLRRWMCRNLTLEGKILIVKTFGLSQLIYNLQCYQILSNEITLVERLIFRFIWSKKWDYNKKVIDRISRKVMKSEYKDGGLRAPDMECLDRALKLKQFVRASSSSHIIKKIQEISISNIGYEGVIEQEYDKLCEEDWIIRIGQETINILTDWARKEGYGTNGNGQSSTIAINTVGSINLSTYLKRKKELLMECIYKTLQREGIDTLKELLIEEEFTTESTKVNNIIAIKKKFSDNLIQIGENYNEEINIIIGGLTHFYIGENKFTPVSEISVKTLQHILKLALKKTDTTDYNNKLGIIDFDNDDIIETRRNVSNVKLRNIFFRLINKDFFTKDRLFRFKMTEDNKCDRCNLEETTKHLLWECKSTRMMWKSFNTILNESGLNQFSVNDYNEVYKFNGTGAVSTIKLKLINELIQIVRPTNMTIDRVKRIIQSLRTTEKYIATKNKNNLNFEKRWKDLKMH